LSAQAEQGYLADATAALLDPRLALNGFLVYQTSGRGPR
jgi:hypothetical protein